MDKFENVDPQLVECMNLEAWSVRFSEGPFAVTTRSGSVYHLETDGTITGGSIFIDGREGEAWGAAYRKGGPIRMEQVVVGLGIEIHDKAKPDRVALTTPVMMVAPTTGEQTEGGE